MQTFLSFRASHLMLSLSSLELFFFLQIRSLVPSVTPFSSRSKMIFTKPKAEMMTPLTHSSGGSDCTHFFSLLLSFPYLRSWVPWMAYHYSSSARGHTHTACFQKNNSSVLLNISRTLTTAVPCYHMLEQTIHLAVWSLEHKVNWSHTKQVKNAVTSKCT